MCAPQATSWAKTQCEAYAAQATELQTCLDRVRTQLVEQACIDLGVLLNSRVLEGARRRIEAAADLARERASLSLLQELLQQEKQEGSSDKSSSQQQQQQGGARRSSAGGSGGARTSSGVGSGGGATADVGAPVPPSPASPSPAAKVAAGGKKGRASADKGQDKKEDKQAKEMAEREVSVYRMLYFTRCARHSTHRKAHMWIS